MAEPKPKATSAKIGKREINYGPFIDFVSNVIAVSTSQAMSGGVEKLAGIVKAAFTGKGRDEPVTPEELGRLVHGIKSEITTLSMPESYKQSYQEIMQDLADDTHSAMLVSDDAVRALKLLQIKRDVRERINNLDQRYREESFEYRMAPQLGDAHRAKLEVFVRAMTPERRNEWFTMRERIKSTQMICGALDHAAGGEDFLERLQVYLGSPPKPDPKKVLADKINEGGRLFKQGVQAVDDLIKGMIPYEDLKFPHMKFAESWEDYWDRVVADPAVQTLKESAGETDDALKKRLQADKKFVARMERELEARNVRRRKARG